MNEHECGYEATIQEMKTWQTDKGVKIDEMYEAMVGTPNGSKHGFNLRLYIVERWKKGVNVVVGSIGGAAVLGFFAWVFTKL